MCAGTPDRAKPNMTVLPHHVRDLWLLPTPLRRRSDKEPAKDRAAAQDNMCVHRSLHAISARRRSNGCSERNSASANNRKQHQTSAHQLLRHTQPTWRAYGVPPTGEMCTPWGALQPWRATASLMAALGRSEPSPLDGLTRVVSTTSWTPQSSGKPSATISQRLPSRTLGTNKSRPPTSTLVATRAPASRAPTLSTNKSSCSLVFLARNSNTKSDQWELDGL